MRFSLFLGDVLPDNAGGILSIFGGCFYQLRQQFKHDRKATVDDNKDLMDANPDYVKQLELLPEDKRRAHRYGDWNALAGTYFEEFTDGVHTCNPFPIPRDWARYRAFDYCLISIQTIVSAFYAAIDKSYRLSSSFIC